MSMLAETGRVAGRTVRKNERTNGFVRDPSSHLAMPVLPYVAVTVRGRGSSCQRALPIETCQVIFCRTSKLGGKNVTKSWNEKEEGELYIHSAPM